jgi:hypothetical protein
VAGFMRPAFEAIDEETPNRLGPQALPFGDHLFVVEDGNPSAIRAPARPPPTPPKNPPATGDRFSGDGASKWTIARRGDDDPNFPAAQSLIWFCK